MNSKELIYNDKLLESLLKLIPEPAAIMDFNFNLLAMNKIFKNMTGTCDNNLFSLIHPLDKSSVKKILKEFKKNKRKTVFEKKYVINNHFFILNTTLSMIQEERVLLIARDITMQQIIVKKSQEYFSVLDNNIISSRTDLEGNILSVSKAFCKISGYSSHELLGQNHSIIKHQDTKKELYKDIWLSLLSERIWEGEIKNKRKDGTHYWVKVYICAEFDINGDKVGYIAINQDITEEKHIEEVSSHDPLTGIYNRRFFQHIIPKTINSLKRNNLRLSFLMIDIDYFKQYNDTYGHKMGDKALKKVAEVFQQYMKRADDYCFRLGGEEFSIVFKVKDKNEAVIFANKIKNAIEDLKIIHQKNHTSKYLTISMGLICKLAKDIDSMDTLYNEADELLYMAKSNGRNRVEYQIT